MTKPSPDDIARALKIEREVPYQHLALYLRCMNDLPMSQRKTDRELHNGCLLTHYVYLYALGHQT